MPVVLSTEIRENVGFEDGLLKKIRTAKRKAIKLTARYWHSHIFPRHFAASAESEYGQEDRGKDYKDRKLERTGKAINLILSGKSRRFMLALEKISATKEDAAIVTMPVPRYFTLPKIGRFINFLGREKEIARQPDKPTEATETSDRDRKDLDRFMKRVLKRELSKSKATRTVKIGSLN